MGGVENKITLKEIAKLAGVSPATVSLVLNNKGSVSVETRQRIQKILADNNYEISRNRKPAERTFLFFKYIDSGMIVDENQGFISDILDQIELSCSKRGIQLVMRVVHKEQVKNIISELSYAPVDGIFILGTELDNEQFPLLDKISVPVLVIDNICRYQRFPCIVMSNFEAVHSAVAHLYELGHQKIGYLSGSLRISNFVERETSFRTALSAYGLPWLSKVVLTPTINGAYADMMRYIKEGGHIEKAYFADNDTIAIGALKALQDSGYSIPNDVSIVGMDDIPYSAVTSPPLTTVRIARKEIGSIAVKTMEELSQKDIDVSASFRIVVIGELVVRESTAKV